MNTCHFVGRVGQDPQPIGTSGTRFSLAIDEYNSQTKQQETLWVPFVAFGKTAEIATKYVTKGRLLRVSGKFQIHEYEYNGEKRKDSNFFITELELLPDGKGKAAVTAVGGDPVPNSGDKLW